MEQLFSIVNSDQAFLKAVNAFALDKKHSYIYGVTGAQKRMLIAASYAKNPRSTLVVLNSRDNIKEYLTDLAAFLPNVPVYELPQVDIITFTADAKSIEMISRRMDILGRLVRNEPIIILATAEAVMQKVITKEQFLNNRITLNIMELIQREDLIAKLVHFGYERVDQVDGIGQFSVRGGIIDIFAVNSSNPIRMELFGDQIDSLREFDTQNQRSVCNHQHVDIMPLTYTVCGTEAQVVFSYLASSSTIIFDEPGRIREMCSRHLQENPELKKSLYTWQDLITLSKNYTAISLSLMLQKVPHAVIDDIISIAAKSIASYHRQIDLLVNELKIWHDKKYTTIIFITNAEKAVSIHRNLVQEGVDAVYSENIEVNTPGMVIVTTGTISGGFELLNAKVVLLAEVDIFGRQKKKGHLRPAKKKKINYFTDINIGDYVVHINHGIGKYVGVETLCVGDVHKDYLHIRYAGEDKLYVPTDQVHFLHKYIGAEGQTPRLSKMGGSDWLKAKTKAKTAVTDLAKELLALYAQRQISQGFGFEPDTTWQREFEDAFPYEETPDQLVAIKEVKADMESSKLMDRLLCGDVGFGKTEVAIRAAFKAVMSSKQVAVLVPTTVLAQQHFQTFTSRFSGFGPVVDVISRFRNAKEQKATLERLKEGQIDILIGTHRILQSDVVFKDLGLLIVDEEQRFGVAQKERLKKLRNKIDVLTLTATPIPRTLHMSLAGARDMSIIETPPEERLPVQTYVVEYNGVIIRDAIRRELKRGGSVYFVYNRVQTIDKMYQHLCELVPEAKIKVAHGQMPEELLEAAMLEFYEGKYDILLCTSIIENGLDVPNANTIIVYAADCFGISQLYQMRGRVGRSSRLAYSYFTYRKDKVLTEVAEKRLQAIKEFTELGSGFKIAMRDLEIRGAGNLLGAQQHGHIVSVGFEMYCRLLDETIQELKNEKSVEPPPEPLIELDIDAYLTGDYISDGMHKIEVYQRIAAVRTEEHLKDLIDEMIDRFGEPPKPVVNLLSVARIKNYARKIGIRSIVQSGEIIKIIFDDNPNITVENILQLKSRYPSRVIMNPGPPGSLTIKIQKLTQPLMKWLEDFLNILAIN